MSNKVDKLFKDKLEGHALPPSAQAWEKVEAHLSKKNKTIIWFRVAAVTALAGLLTFALLQWKEGERMNQPLVKQNNTTTEQKIIPAIAQKEKEQQPIEEKLPVTKRNSSPLKKERKENLQQEVTITKQEKKNQVTLLPEEKISEPQIVAAPAKKSMKLTFSLPALHSKNEVKEEVTVAAVEEKKTTLQKAADVAYEIRSGEVMVKLGEAKDDLFAREFKKDKSKKQQ